MVAGPAVACIPWRYFHHWQLESVPCPAVQVEIALDFARGMAYLHSRRQPIVHRDLKPANLMIAGNLHADTEQLYLDSGIIKVADFGEHAAGRWRGRATSWSGFPAGITATIGSPTARNR